MAKKETAKTKVEKLERTYNIPLRREFLKVANWRKAEKAVTAVKQFLMRHMKSKDVKLGKELNEIIWQHGIKNPPHHVKVTALRNEKGEVRANLFGVAIAVPKEEKAKAEKKETKKESEVKKEVSKDKAQ